MSSFQGVLIRGVPLYLLLHGFGIGLSLLPPLVDTKERSHVVHPLDEARAGTKRDDGVVLGLIELGVVSDGRERLGLTHT